MSKPRRLLPALLPTLLASSCWVSFPSSGIRVDGVDLEEEHEETIELSAWSPEGLILETGYGGVRIEATTGPTVITATLHEKTLRDARLRYEDGRLVSETRSGEPSAIGDVLILSNGPIPGLRLASGMGDLELRDVSVEGRIRMETGMGDVLVDGSRSGDETTLCTGMGDILVEGFECGSLEASTGMGDIELAHVTAARADLSSGMGDIDVRDCSMDWLEAGTGLGDIDCRDTRYDHGDFDTGFGSVSTD